MPLARGGRPVRGAFTGTASRPVPLGTGLELFSGDRQAPDARVVRVRWLASALSSALAHLLPDALASAAGRPPQLIAGRPRSSLSRLGGERTTHFAAGSSSGRRPRGRGSVPRRLRAHFRQPAAVDGAQRGGSGVSATLCR